MISHVSNDEVLQTAASRPLPGTLEERQSLMLGHVAVLPGDSIVTQSVLRDGGVMPRTVDGNRKRGRPKLSWCSLLFAKAVSLCGGDAEMLHQHLCSHASNFHSWKGLVQNQGISS